MQKTSGINIRIVNQKAFSQEMMKIKKFQFVDYPWTYRETIKDSKCATEPIRGCTAAGILLNKEVVATHIDPFDRDNQDFGVIANSITNIIGKDIPLGGFVIGSQKSWRKSVRLFESFRKFFEDTLKIPFSMFRGVSGERNSVGFICDAKTHDLAIADAMGEGLRAFDEVMIAAQDKVSIG